MSTRRTEHALTQLQPIKSCRSRRSRHVVARRTVRHWAGFLTSVWRCGFTRSGLLSYLNQDLRLDTNQLANVDLSLARRTAFLAAPESHRYARTTASQLR